MIEMLTDKTLPHAPDLEGAVLGAILLDSQAITDVCDILLPEHFSGGANQALYRCIVGMYNVGRSIDMLTVAEELVKVGEIERVGGIPYLINLTNRVASSHHITTHAKIIVEKWMRRKLISDCLRTTSDAYDESVDVFQVCEQAERNIFEVSNVNSSGEPKHISEAMNKLVVRNISIRSGEVGAEGVPSGYQSVDNCIKTFGNSDLIIVAARPGMGKTAFVVGCAIEQAKMGIPVLIFSLEMSSTQISARIISYLTELPVDVILKATYNEAEEMQIVAATELYSSLPIYIDDSSLSPLQLVSKARRAKLKHKIGVVMVDYIQIIPYTEKNRSRENEISHISGSLKRLAKQINVPVIALSQLSRSVEQRGGDKRPMLSDLRESGSIEQDADMVCFLYRPEYYGITQDGNGSSTIGTAEVIVAKHRNGKTGIINMGFRGHCAKYYDIRHSDLF